MSLSAKNETNGAVKKDPPKAHSTMDLLLGNDKDPEEVVGPDGLPFFQMCQPCTLEDTDKMIQNNILGGDPSQLLEAMLPIIGEDQPLGENDRTSEVKASTAENETKDAVKEDPPKAPSTMDLLLGNDKNPEDVVGTDGLPFFQMCQPCSVQDTDKMIQSNVLGGNPSRLLEAMLPAIEEDQPLDRTKELRALYMASAVSRDDLPPLDYSDPLLGALEAQSHSPQPAFAPDDYQQLAEHLWHQQQEQEREYYASWKDAQHWSKAFGVQLESERDDEPIRIQKRPRKETSKSGLGHKEVIFGVSIRHDGKYVATASQDSTVCIWEVATNKLIKTLKGHDVKYECLRVDWASSVWAEDVLDRSFRFPNLIASSGADGTVKLWSCKDQQKKDDGGFTILDNNWKCEYTLDHGSLNERNKAPKPTAETKEEETDESDNKPQVYALQFVDHWKVFTKEMICSRHSKQQKETETKAENDVTEKNSFLMTSSDDFVHLWEVEKHSLDQKLSLDGQRISILQEKIKLKEVMSLHFGPLDQFGYGVTACSITGEGVQLPPPPSDVNNRASTTTAFGGERNPENKIFVFEAAYSPGSGLLGVALSDGSLRLVNGRGSCISVVNLPGNQSHLTSFCWDSTGNRLATCVGTGHLITWSLDAESHQGGNYNTVATCNAIFEGGHQPGRPLFGSRFCGGKDENLLMSWGIDGRLCMWYSKAQGNIYEPVSILKEDDNYPIYALDVSSSDQSVVLGGGGSDGGFIGIPLHFYNIPPQRKETGASNNSDQYPQGER